MDNFVLQENDKAIESQYLIMNPMWEHQLQEFDANLKILLDKQNQRWLIAEFLPENKYPNVVMYLEDENGKPKEFGPWVINKLFVKASRWAAVTNKNKYLDELAAKAQEYTDTEQEKLSEESQYQITHDINKWKRAANAMENLPTSDVTAGYPKYTPKTESKEPV